MGRDGGGAAAWALWRGRGLWWHPPQPALLVFLPVAALLLCEYGLYYLAIARCGGFPPVLPPHLPNNTDPADVDVGNDLNLLIIADTHLLGPTGHWFDRMRREWQMERAFQSAVSVLGPDAALVLGDATDEGKWEEDVARFRHLIRHDSTDVQLEVVVGNHDIGFHDRMTSSRVRRFEMEFGESNRLFFVKDQPFVVLNSMAFEDECHLCQVANGKLEEIVQQLKTVDTDSKRRRPILLTHFPLFRSNQEYCTDLDITSELVQKLSEFEGDELQDGVLHYSNIPNKDVVSRDATNHIMSRINPAFVFSGHTHYHCLYQHANGVQELTVSTFSWRNRADPSFVLATVHPTRRKGKRFRAPRRMRAWEEAKEEYEDREREESVEEMLADRVADEQTQPQGFHDVREEEQDGAATDVDADVELDEDGMRPGQTEEEDDGEEEVREVEIYYKRCELPSETTIVVVYTLSAIAWLASLVSMCCGCAPKVASKATSRKMLKLV